MYTFALKYNSYLSLNLIASYISNCFLWPQGLKVHNLSKGNNTQETDIYFLMWIWKLLKFLSYLNDELCSWERQIKSLENQEGLHIQYRQWTFKHKWHSEKISTWGAKWCLSRWYVLLSVKQKGTMAASPGPSLGLFGFRMMPMQTISFALRIWLIFIWTLDSLFPSIVGFHINYDAPPINIQFKVMLSM